MKRALLALALLTGCSGASDAPGGNAATSLEAGAIARGLVRDPEKAALTGLYARETDRLCVAEDRIGVHVDYGQGIGCSATGSVERRGEVLAVSLGDAGDCRFDASYDGERIVFPAQVPEGCRRFCRSRASLAAVTVVRLSGSASEAMALRDGRGRTLCVGN